MKIKERHTVYEGFANVESLLMEDEGKTFKREIFRNKDAVAALVFDTAKNHYIFTEQYRVAAERPLVEIVAGLLDKEGESPEVTIAREIEEETGYQQDRLEFIAEFYTSPGATSEKMYLYYAEVNRKTGDGGGIAGEHEKIKTVAFTAEKLQDQRFEDAKTIMAVTWLKAQGRI